MKSALLNPGIIGVVLIIIAILFLMLRLRKGGISRKKFTVPAKGKCIRLEETTDDETGFIYKPVFKAVVNDKECEVAFEGYHYPAPAEIGKEYDLLINPENNTCVIA